MALYRKCFATREEGADEIVSYSETLWKIAEGPPDSWQDFLTSLQKYIDSLPLPLVVREPGERGEEITLLQERGHITFKNPKVSFEVIFFGGVWRFDYWGEEINSCPDDWQGIEEFP